ncbi:CRISPR-associated protein Cas3 [Streptomyces sp. CB03578]|uniref:CRISPR-associated helicase/endonuclease Cas3 n=1 Tax=Streptomyces sp. CB03578 TaxID=1718987 RepID=UPI00093923FE|nr:CRISPR-associated helicase/endonuclease Cas3 [Streptomyces sp. CB03578]OKI31575.1 CRISPR-associated protein Cas3 [Streptomyces sp. CB03578]
MRKPWCEADQSLWGKARGLDPELPPYPLVRHLLDAAAVALFLWDAYLSESQRRCIAAGFGLSGDLTKARLLVGLCAGLHDIGKVSGFQFCDRLGAAYLSAGLVGDQGKIGSERFGHDVAGMRAVPEVLAILAGRVGELTEGELEAVNRIAEVVGGHHGCFHRFEDVQAELAYRDLLGGVTWADQRVAHAGAVFGLLGEPELPQSFSATSAVLVTGVVILADWLVSQEGYLKGRQRSLEPELGEHFARSCRDAGRLVREAGLLPVELQRRPFAEAYGIAGGPNALQRSVASVLPAVLSRSRQSAERGSGGGILVVTAAPGDGKTEAALEAERVLSGCFGTRGFAFLLPTMATSDQMHARVAGVLARQGGVGAGLTLTHSMAWLSAAYAGEAPMGESGRVLVCDGDEERGGGAARYQADMRPVQWLRGAKRPLLAQFAVGTVDQALMGVLPVRHNALRLLALSGKTLIVDEAHAYDPYMQVLLGRLLNWMGAFGVPVVLLSATLPVSVSDQLVKEYLTGAGHRGRALRRRSFPVPYPGWLYVDGSTGECAQIDARDREEQVRQRRMRLRVQVEPVVAGTGGAGRSRLAVIERVLAPVLDGGEGCVLVVCNTVAEAQEVFTHLKSLCSQASAEGDVQLLHARFPGDVREARTLAVTSGMGRSGPRPVRRIVVATQVVEQSLDLDADVVISDLAPLALLLQRAGRCWRHESWWKVHGRPGGRARPGWAVSEGPRLVVLDPVAGGGVVPGVWRGVYHEALLKETSDVLVERGEELVALPEDVQGLVERVHGDRPDRFDWASPEASAVWTAYLGEKSAERAAGGFAVMERAGMVAGLSALHREGRWEEWEATTRLGADSVRLLCVYVHPGGRVTLDAEGEVLLPAADLAAALSVSDVRQVMGRTIAVRADWFRDATGVDLAVPEGWAEHPMLGDLVVLRQPVRDGLVGRVTVGSRQIWLDGELGLCRA